MSLDILRKSTEATVKMIDALSNFNNEIKKTDANVREAADRLEKAIQRIEKEYPIIVSTKQREGGEVNE